MVTRKSSTKETWPKITKGSHLTVFEYENGSKECSWDFEKLLDEVRIATNETTSKIKKAKTKKQDK